MIKIKGSLFACAGEEVVVDKNQYKMNVYSNVTSENLKIGRGVFMSYKTCYTQYRNTISVNKRILFFKHLNMNNKKFL